MRRSFETVLIANRGEIACRIVRTARRMGLRTVAVFSEADREALHVEMADVAVHIGPAPAAESYLDAARIIAAAVETGSGAVHPGYGFLSENADFAEACAAAGLVFVGPTPAAIRAMGSKAQAKALMAASGVPLVPGYHGAAQDAATLRDAASRAGYPVLVKASAGGGGKGMRIARGEAELAEAVAAAKREAKAAFGDDHLLIEKLIERPRHIEVQIFGDSHGNVVSLFERECTLQRRHQKVIEEAPAARLAEDQRQAISAAARAAGAAVGYVGAGTVEFVANDEGFHFIEMNTRLQVEHPVTEMITGIDLVEWQLRVAAGEPLPLRQDEIRRVGHAFEARIYAEDAERGFLPSIGRIGTWRQPATGEGVRVDTGFREGDQVTPFYDPMLAKLIVHGADRAQALARLTGALDRSIVMGVKTNIGFLRALASHPDVAAGAMDTGLIERELAALTAPSSPAGHDVAAAVAAVLAREAAGRRDGGPWGQADGWMIAGERRRRVRFEADGASHEATLVYRRQGLLLEAAAKGGAAFAMSIRPDARLDVFYDGCKETVDYAWSGADFELVSRRGRFRLHLVDVLRGQDADISGGKGITAPMPGSIRQVLAEPGNSLEKGAPVLVMEAMKMEHVLRAPSAGRLVAFRCAVGDFVQEGAELAEFEPSKD
ncbi:MAG: acetyl-CoA carboxylase biotin carboxylase subunit [Rhizobiaceae bacterium]|nr:acetyl-CoA carboxylase biotin carboxylase subunit [Rhizobiaceae bacterium]